jgi:N-acetyl-anhydromuramyl-L-alanine amidase AmpD
MSVQPRQARVFAALMISMAAGTLVLMNLGSNPPAAGAFCLSTYHHLVPVEKTILSRAAQHPDRWTHIAIYYNGTKSGNIEPLVPLNGPPGMEDVNCHFVICNGLGGGDGQIQTTEKWQTQSSVIQDQTWRGRTTIRICIIADGKTTRPTDFQIKRVEALVELLCRKFEIRPENVYYPNDW